MLQQAAILAVALQLGLLCAWSTGSSWFLALMLALGLGWLIALDNVPTTLPWASRAKSLLAGPTGQQLAVGSLGMLLGAWADAHFEMPPCMCCRWGPGTSAILMATEHLWTWSTLGMMVGCLGTMLAAWANHRAPPKLAGILACTTELLGMSLGMLAFMRPTAEAMRFVFWGKLGLGHAAMVMGMGLGIWLCRTLADAIAPERR